MYYLAWVDLKETRQHRWPKLNGEGGTLIAFSWIIIINMYALPSNFKVCDDTCKIRKDKQ